MAAVRVLCELSSFLEMGMEEDSVAFGSVEPWKVCDTALPAPFKIIGLFGVLMQAKCCNPRLNLQ